MTDPTPTAGDPAVSDAAYTSSTAINPASTSTESFEDGDDDDDDDSDPLERKGNQIALGCGLGIGLATLFVTAYGVWKQRSKIPPIMFMKSPSFRRPRQKQQLGSSENVPLQATSTSVQQTARQSS